MYIRGNVKLNVRGLVWKRGEIVVGFGGWRLGGEGVARAALVLGGHSLVHMQLIFGFKTWGAQMYGMILTVPFTLQCHTSYSTLYSTVHRTVPVQYRRKPNKYRNSTGFSLITGICLSNKIKMLCVIE